MQNKESGAMSAKSEANLGAGTILRFSATPGFLRMLLGVEVSDCTILPISVTSIDSKAFGDIPEHDRLDFEEGGCKSKGRINR